MFAVNEDGGNHMKSSHQPCNRHSSDSSITDTTGAGCDSTSADISKSHPNQPVSGNRIPGGSSCTINAKEVEVTGDADPKMSNDPEGRDDSGRQAERKGTVRRRRRRRLIMQEDEEKETVVRDGARRQRQ